MRFPYPWVLPFILILDSALCKKGEMFRTDVEKTSQLDEPLEADPRLFKPIYGLSTSWKSAGVERRSRAWGGWGGWGACRGGLRTRRRHCERPDVCGHSLRIETQRCGSRLPRPRYHQPPPPPYSPHHPLLSGTSRNSSRHYLTVTAGHRGEGGGGGAARGMRGFTPWSPWTKCSRKCTTVRRRQCRRQALCGRRVLRESAYCYLEGSYCQHWIRSRLPSYSGADNNVMGTSAAAANASRSAPAPPTPHPRTPPEPECGRINPLRGAGRARAPSLAWPALRVVGGRPAPPGKWPWQVAVLNIFKEAFCGGTLVSLRWAVTAAHCVRRRLYVRVGEHDLRTRSATELDVRIAAALVHPLYDPNTVDNDVAMLRLAAAARPELGHGTACLPRPHEPLPPRTACTILGWGKRSHDDEYGASLLQEAQVSTVAQSVCRHVYWEYAITDNMVCAGRGRRDSCAGDSGGPLLCRRRGAGGRGARYFLHGITSFGDGCGQRGKYGIYTRTANYVTWIRHVIATDKRRTGD